MDTKTIFVLTPKGEEEISHRTSLLDGDIKRALSMVDGTSSFAEISKRAAPSLRSMLADLLKELLKRGYIQDKARVSGGGGAKIVTPKMSIPKLVKPEQGGTEELDFTSMFRAPSAEDLLAAGEKIKAKHAESEAQKIAEAEIARRESEHEERLKSMREAQTQEETKAKALAEENRLRTEQDAKLKAEEEAKAKQEAQLKFEVEAKAKQEAEALRVKAEQEAKRVQEEADQRAKAQAEFARLKAEQEAEIAKKEAELTKKKAEAEAKARDFAERRAKIEAEAARVKAEQEAARVKAEQEAARVKAEQEAARVKAEIEAARAKAEAEARARAEAEEKGRQAAEAARVQAELAAAKAKEENERIKREAEQAAEKAKEEAARIKREAEQAAEKAKEEAARIKREAEESAAKVKEEAERVKREAEAQAKLIEDAARKAQQEADEARFNAEQEAVRVREVLEAAKQKAEQESQARLEAEALRLAEERTTEQARASIAQAAIQAMIQERELVQQALEQQAIKAREEEQIRAKQLALAAVSTQVRDTSKQSDLAMFKLDSIDLDALTIKPIVTEAPVTQDAVVTTAPASEQVQESPNQISPVDDDAAKELALKEQIRKAEEDRLEADVAARKLADAQAKAWAEAELRAIEAAKQHANFQAEQVAHATQAKHQVDKKLRAAQKKRKPIPWGGIAIGLFALAVLAVFLVPMLMPTQKYASELEKILAEKLQQPVHIGKLSGRILPTPQVELSEIYIGEIKQIKAQQAQLSFGFSALFGEVKRIDRIELQGAEINAGGLLDIPDWLQKMSADAEYPISKVVFNAAKLNGDAMQISDLAGEVNFDPTGQFSNAVLRAYAGKAVLDIKTSAANGLEAVFNLKNSALPLLPNWNFEELTAKGVLGQNGFVIDDIDGRISGGMLQGKARIDWKSGWSASGSLNTKSISLNSINNLLTGDMDGAATFKMQSDSLSNLPKTAVLEGSVAVKKGVIDGVDIIETARLHSKVSLPGGRTHFDEMNSALAYSNDAYHFKSMKISNSVLNSSGSMDVVKQQLSGRLSAHLSIQDGMGTVELQIGGTAHNPTLRAVR